MSKEWLIFLDYFFLIFHTLIVIFNLFGWIWNKTRKAHLLLVLATLFSWFILGIWYGMGYCFCTDWHWQVREALGDKNLPYSYIQFLIYEITRITVPNYISDYIIGVPFGISILISAYLNIRDWLKKKNIPAFKKPEKNS